MLCENKIYVCDEYSCEGPYDHESKTFNGFCKINYSNGNYYEGHLKQNLYHNRGTLNVLGQYKYIGPWYQGKKYGVGTIEYDDGDIYNGDFENDMRSGFGTLKSKKVVMIYDENKKEIVEYRDETYVGNWKDDKRERSGELTRINKFLNSNQIYYCVYKGEWKNNNIDYCEIKQYSDQKYKNLFCTYIGKVNENLLAHDTNGKTISTRIITDGVYINGQLSGSFIKTFIDCTIEKIEANILNGYDYVGGIYYKNGNIYDGEFDHNYQRKGNGKYISKYDEFLEKICENFNIDAREKYENTDKSKKYVYIGVFEYDKIKSGKCEYVINGVKYHYEIKDSKPFSGKMMKINFWSGNKIFIDSIWENGNIISGKCKYTNDSKIYEGQFIYNRYDDYMRHGLGKTTYHTDKFNFDEVCGEYNNDKIIRGVIIYKNGDIYCGEIKNESNEIIKHGKGKMKYKNGDVFDGYWNHNNPSGPITIKNNNGDDYYNLYMCGYGLFSPFHKVEDMISSFGNKISDYLQIQSDDKKEE
jgi:hypothetical protein